MSGLLDYRKDQFRSEFKYQVATSMSLRCPSCNGLKEPGNIIFLLAVLYMSASKTRKKSNTI